MGRSLVLERIRQPDKVDHCLLRQSRPVDPLEVKDHEKLAVKVCVLVTVGRFKRGKVTVMVVSVKLDERNVSIGVWS